MSKFPTYFLMKYVESSGLSVPETGISSEILQNQPSVARKPPFHSCIQMIPLRRTPLRRTSYAAEQSVDCKSPIEN